MSDSPSNPSDDATGGASDAPYGPPSAGAVLRGAREAAGLSIDAVAQQLKLAPRQVQALEDDDFERLPGRTFVRGFVRNYARHVGLDPDEVVSLLPGADVAPSLQRPTITPSGRAMGQLPADATPRRSWTRWAIPLALVAIAGAAGVYELRRPLGQGDVRKTASDPATRAPAAAQSVGGTTSATLPNPLGADTAATPAEGVASGPGATVQGTVPPAAAADAATAPAAGSSTPPAPAAAAPASPIAAPGAGASAADALLVLRFRGTSWVQVKDRNGNVLFAETGQPGMTQAVNGALPLDIVIGNAPAVSATFRGQAVDLAPYVRANVARLSIK